MKIYKNSKGEIVFDGEKEVLNNKITIVEDVMQQLVIQNFVIDNRDKRNVFQKFVDWVSGKKHQPLPFGIRVIPDTNDNLKQAL